MRKLTTLVLALVLISSTAIAHFSMEDCSVPENSVKKMTIDLNDSARKLKVVTAQAGVYLHHLATSMILTYHAIDIIEEMTIFDYTELTPEHKADIALFLMREMSPVPMQSYGQDAVAYITIAVNNWLETNPEYRRAESVGYMDQVGNWWDNVTE